MGKAFTRGLSANDKTEQRGMSLWAPLEVPASSTFVMPHSCALVPQELCGPRDDCGRSGNRRARNMMKEWNGNESRRKSRDRHRGVARHRTPSGHRVGAIRVNGGFN